MLITSSAERNAKYKREQELKRAMFALGNPTVDQKYITDFGNSASKFISDSAKGVSGVAFGQSQQALDRYNTGAQRLKYQKLVIEDFLERNAEKGSYTDLQNALNNIQKGIDNVGNAYINTHNMMSQYKTEDDYNRDKITSQHVGSTYDEILAEINRLGEEQKKQTPEQAAKTQKSRDVLNNLLYNNNYIERDSYQKAIANIDRQITALEGQINVIGTGKNPMLDKYYVGKEEENQKKRDQLNYLYTVKSTLEEKEKITEFTELPAKLGEHNFQIGVSNGKIKGQYNPTAEQLKQWVQKYADSSYDEQTKMLDEKPEIVDPLGFVEQNPDLWAQEGQNSRLSNIFLTEIYNHAKEYHWDEITPEEKDIYYFTLNRLGKDKAMEYLSLLERYFGQRYAANITKSIEEFTDKAGWLGGTFINIALIPVSMIGNAEAALIGFRDYVSGEGINPYSSANRLRLGTTAIRSGTAKEWGKAADWELFGKNVFEQSFNILMSTGESLFGGLALGPAYMFFAGSGAAMSTAQDIYDRGGSANQVFFGALASGIAEAVFEKISIDRLLSGAESITGFKEMFKQILIQGGVEASEEVLTEMANTISDNLIMAEKSTVSLRVKELIDENPSMTPTEARKKAEMEVVTEVIWAGLSGFISGGLNIGVMGTTGIVANKFDQKKQSVATQQVIGNQLKSDGTAEAFVNFAISQGLAKDGTTVDSLSSEALGKVYQDFCDKFYETASKSKTSTELLSVVEKYNTEETPNVVKRYVGAVTATVLAEHPEWAPETSEATTVDVDGVVDDSAGGVEAAEESVLPNVSAVAPEADPIKDDAFAARGLERLTEEQRFLKSIGETLGRKVEFQNLDKWVKDPETGNRRRVSPGGMINKTTGVLYLNSSKYANQNALREVLKHEITHFAEVDADAYALLQKGIMDSQAFKDWVKRKGYKGAVNEDGYAVSATSNMNAAYIKRYAESGLEGTEVFRGKDAVDAANREMVADFVAENLFTDDMSRLRDALSDVQPEAVNKFKQWILDLLKKLKNAFRSQAKVYASIEGIESEFVKVCKSAQRIWEQNHKPTAEQQKTSTESGGQYSFAGQKSKTADYSLLDQAIKLEEVGKATPEDIRQQTGWFRGYDGKWRYEISDRDIEVDTTGKFHTNPDIRRQTELFNKVYFDGTATEDEIEELQVLNKNLKGVSAKPKKLGQLIKHDKLFEAYPFLKDVDIRFEYISERGAYNPVFNEIVLSNNIKLNKEQLTKTLIHEIQHAIQYYEGFAHGSNTEYWREMGIDEAELFKYYENTAGEVEARDSASRWWRSDEARKEMRPDIDRTDVVFADDGVAYSATNDIDRYTEKQYNNFGWVRYNDVLSAKEYETLLSRYADYKHNKDFYPTTRFGETVIHSSECLDVIMYVKGSIRSPQITKVVRINADDYNSSIIKEWILQNEYGQVSQPFSAIEDAYGQEIFVKYRKRDFASFQEYRTATKGNGGKKSNTVSGVEQNGARGVKQNTETDRADLNNESAFSMPESKQYSLPQEVEEEYEGHRQKALELFGTTTDFRVTGFTLPDGKTLKLSKYGVLGTQHRLIEAVYDDLKGDKAINQFIQEGNVRIKAAAPGIEIGEKIAPTVSQLNTVARLIRQELYKRGVFYLDITAENGDSIASVEYTEDDTIEDIFYDIKAYYERGRVPTTSSINVSWYSQFAYSLPEAMSQFDALPFAKEIVEKYGKTTMSTDDIATEMGKALSSISHGQWAHAFQIAQEIAETFEGNKTKTITNAIYNGLVRERESFLQDRAVSKPKERLASEREENRDLKKSKKSLEEKVKRRDNTLASIEIKHVVTEDRRKNIGHFHSVYNRLATRLKGNTDAKHIPEHLKGFVASFLEIFDLKSAVVDGTRVRKTFTSKDIAKFIREYTNTETDNFGTPNMAYDESIKEFLEYLYDKADTEDGVSIPELDAYDIMMLSNLADNVMQIVKMSEETFRNGRAIEFEELSDPCFADLKDKKQKTGWRNAAADWFRNLAQKNMTPPYFFKQLGEGFYRLYNDIVKGQGQWAVNFKKAQEFVKELKNKYNYEKWNKSSVTLKTERGDSIKLTIEQAMQLYATFKRQVSNTDQDAQHLNIGGIVLEDAISTSNWDKIKSDLDSIKNNSEFDEGTKKKKLQEVWNAFHEQYDSNAIPLTYNDLMSVQTLLSEDQKGYADGWVRYLSNNMAELGNQTSMMLFGYEKFHEQNYIPYNSAENYLYSQPGMATGDERIKHLSFTKNTIKGAATPLVLSSLSEVCASHVDKMCMYNAMAIPLENLNKVFNCKHYAEDGSVTANLRNDISKTFGPEAVKYLRQFIEDANGSVRGSSDEGFWDSLTSKFKKSAVLASLSVVIQQPSAMYRAMAYINPKYFTKLKDVKGFRKNYEQLCKYAPVALIKQMGRFDTGVGVGNVKWLLQDETLMDKLDDKASFLASYADEVTWGHIWTAVKAEAAAETDLQVGSEEFFKYCGQRFTEVINLTQVYDSTLVKSQHMRNKSTLAKMITSFMAEPTVTYNIIADALYRAKTEGKSGKKFAGRAVGAVLTSIIANVLLKSLVYAARDDEEDKNLIENYFKQVTQNFVDELNPFGFVPYFRDISSLWQGYDVNRADTTLIGDLINAIKSLSSEKTSTFDKIEKLSGAIANAFGVPVRNVVRDIKAVINGVTSIFDNPVSLEGIKYAQKEGLSEAVEKVTGGLIDKDEVFSYYGRMVEAIEDGDEETYNEIYDLLIENGVSEDDIISEIKKAASVSRNVNQQVSSYVGEISRTSTYKSFDDEDRKKLKSKIQEALGVQKLDDIIPGSDSQFDKLYQAKRNNNTTYKKLKKQLIDRGFTEDEIQLKLFLAELRYIESKGIDIHEWALAEIAKSKKYADTDGSGGVSKKESYQAIKNLDVDTKAINALIDYYKLK